MTYYVDSQLGRPDNSGTSISEPFVMLSQVNDLALLPGDKVCFKRGSTFPNQALVIRARGTKEMPITFTTYGDGSRPRIDTNGKFTWYQDYGTPLDAPTHVYRGHVSSCILLYDAEYIVLEDIELTNRDLEFSDISIPERINRTGVAVVAKDIGDCHDILIQNLYIHHIEGNIYDKHMCNGGIYAVCLKPDNEAYSGVSRFIGLTIKNNVVCDSFRWGIAAGYTYRHGDYKGSYLSKDTFLDSGMLDMTITGNYTERIGGDGITAMYALNPLVESNISVSSAMHMNSLIYSNPGKRRGMVAAGIWSWKCKDAIFRNNEVYDTHLNQDGMAYDCDSGDGTLYENNYSFGNDGGTVMYCLSEAVNSVFRHNKSKKDLLGIITPVENPDGIFESNEITLIKGVPLIRNVNNLGKYKLINNTIIEENYED